MKSFSLTIAAATLLTAPALAQPYSGGPYGYAPPPRGAIFSGPNNTGGAVNVVIPRGALGADTYQSNAAVGSNVSRPELAVPNGSAGGGGGGGQR